MPGADGPDVSKFVQMPDQTVEIAGMGAAEIAAHLAQLQEQAEAAAASAPPEAAPTEAGQGTKPETETGAALRHCPRCGWDSARKPPRDLTDEDRRAYVESLDSDFPFSAEFEYLGGRIAVRMRVLRNEELTALRTQIIAGARRDRSTPAAHFNELNKDALPLLQLVSIRSGGGTLDFEAPEGLAPQITPDLKSYYYSREQYEALPELDKPGLWKLDDQIKALRGRGFNRQIRDVLQMASLDLHQHYTHLLAETQGEGFQNF